MKLFKQYLKESLIVENTELADLKKHLHDQQMKFAAAQKRKDKRAMDFWNSAIKNTEEEIRKTGDFKSKIIRLVAKK